jgi:hypothetical protein
LILATSSSNSLPHLAAVVFWWMTLVEWLDAAAVGGGSYKKTETELGQRVGRTGPKTPLAGPNGPAGQAVSRPVLAHLPPRGSSWHFGLCPLDLCHFEVVIPAIKIGGLLIWSPNFTS